MHFLRLILVYCLKIGSFWRIFKCFRISYWSWCYVRHFVFDGLVIVAWWRYILIKINFAISCISLTVSFYCFNTSFSFFDSILKVWCTSTTCASSWAFSQVHSSLWPVLIGIFLLEIIWTFAHNKNVFIVFAISFLFSLVAPLTIPKVCQTQWRRFYYVQMSR
jgi:hypothetical protein